MLQERAEQAPIEVRAVARLNDECTRSAASLRLRGVSNAVQP